MQKAQRPPVYHPPAQSPQFSSSPRLLPATTMGKQKQQTISRFFAPKPPDAQQTSQPPSHPPPTPPPKVATTISFSPSATSSKREHSKTLASPRSAPLASKKPCPTFRKSLDELLLVDPPSAISDPHYPLENPKKYTPLEQQVVELKSKYPDVLLMVEVGYRYRFFGEDAEAAARVLGIFAHTDHNFLTASIPTFRLHFHVRRLVCAGFKVGVVKQTETAAIKAHGSNRLAPFSRGLSALYSRATIEAAEDLGGGREEGSGASSSNYLFCIVEKKIVAEEEGGLDVKIGFVAVEISTGDVIHGEFKDGILRSGLEAVLLSLSPTEILLGTPLTMVTEKLLRAFAGHTSGVRVECTSYDCFGEGGALAEIIALYEDIADDDTQIPDNLIEVGQAPQEEKTVGIAGIVAMPELAVQAFALTTRHLKVFGFEKRLPMGASFRPYANNFEMTLPANALQQLEITNNNSDGSEEGTLLKVMDNTCTAFGSRLLKHWVTHPLTNRLSISIRLDAVSEISESMAFCKVSDKIIDLDEEIQHGDLARLTISTILSSILKTLGRLPDVQRGITRIFHQTATPAEFIASIRAILFAGKKLQHLHFDHSETNGSSLQSTVHSALLRRLISTASSSTVISHAVNVLSSLNKDAADKGDMPNLFNASNREFPEVVRGHTVVQISQKKLELLIIHYRKQLGMSNLEFTSISGTTHLIEVPSTFKVPYNWVKINSTKKTVRYHPPEVLKALDDLALAKEELAVASRAAWSSFLMEFRKHYAQYQAVVQALAALDCLNSLAILSKNKNYVRPMFVCDDEPIQIEIQCGRHPVLESILEDNFVPNDTYLHTDEESCQIVTGPNMGGKSCYIRQVAVITIMAQVGSFVPASFVKLRVIDGIYTRMGVSDNIQQGRSTFFEELSEASHILHQSSSHSLVIIDELGRGTSTHDGVAIAYATLHYLLEQKKCLVLFVTHYPQILDIQHEFEGCVGAYHVSYLTSEKLQLTDSKYGSNIEIPEQNEVTFLYKIVPGISDKSFGFNVARLAQLPPFCISRAAVMACKLEMEVNARKEDTETPRQPQTTATCSCLIQPEIHHHHHNSSFEKAAASFRRLLFHLQSVSDNVNTPDILSSLRDARELAFSIINQDPWIMLSSGCEL